MFYFLAPLKGETSEVKEFDAFLLISLTGADWRGPGVCVGGGGDWWELGDPEGAQWAPVDRAQGWGRVWCVSIMLKPFVVEGLP